MDYFAHVRSTSHPDPELAFNVQVGTLADPGNRAPRGFVNFVVGRYATGYATTFFRRNAAGSASSEPAPGFGVASSLCLAKNVTLGTMQPTARGKLVR
jgi:hypothetical protein